MNLNNLSDFTLHHDLTSLVKEERNVLAKILWHFKEVDRRKLYSDYKCGSLFEYAVKVLKYSESQASRRVSACRLLRDMPELAAKVESGKINLTHMNQLSSLFKQDDVKDPTVKKEIAKQIEGKSTRESESILDDLKKDKTPRKVNLQLQQGTVHKLNEVRALKAHQFGDMDALLMGMSAAVLDIWNPIKASRRMRDSEGSSRYVQVQVKSQVWERDQGKCQNCGSSFALELDHIQPFARGGKTVEGNLRLLCRNCNQRRGQVMFKKNYSSSRT